MHFMYNLESFKKEIAQASGWLTKEYGQLHTGRATPLLLDSVQVEAYGLLQPLKNVGSVAIEDPKTLRVSAWDKSIIKDIERALHMSHLGFSISVDDQGVRVAVPSLTTERRTQLVKIAKELLEDARITVRKAREAIISELKNQELSEDVFARGKEDVQKMVDSINTELESLFKKKEAEIVQ